MKTKSKKFIAYRYIVERRFFACSSQFPPYGLMPGVFTTRVSWQKYLTNPTQAFRRYLMFYLPPARVDVSQFQITYD